MKKIISIVFLAIFVTTSFSFAIGTDPKPCTTPCSADFECNTTMGICMPKAPTNTGSTTSTIGTTSATTSPAGSVNGITINEACLTNGQCKFNIYDTLGIRKSVRATGDPTSVGIFVQDIVLSATFFIGTVVTLALIVSGLMYIFAAASGKDPQNAKKGISGALIGLVIVACSYFIIRLVQYLAKGV
ncbi:MAG: hypothetical protein NTX91_01830 [candidate division SR1 bacterium]|nr:hypothetical protein [candidate division SR1 bacterium]